MKTAKYFSASWCGPCKMFKPVVQELIDEGHPIEMIDIDENQELALKYSIMSIPALVFEDEGKVVDSLLGATSKEDLIERLS
tara:strand:- start:367 stop:612 length:246 start_codon:yes stop_codon:yes gene_type:complete